MSIQASIKESRNNMLSPDLELRVLLVEDSPEDVKLIVRALRDMGRPVLTEAVCTAAAMREALLRFQPDVILGDFSMPGFDGPEALRIANELAPDIPFIYVSAGITDQLALESMHSGAADYVLKDHMSRLQPAIERALLAAQQARKIKRQAQIQAALSAHGTVVQRAGDTRELLDLSCRAAVEQGHFLAAAIGQRMPDNTLAVSNSYGDAGLVAKIAALGPVAIDETGAQMHPSAQAVLQGRSIITPDYSRSDVTPALRDAMAGAGVAGQIVLPIGRPAWAVLELFSATPQAYDDEMIALLERLTADIDHAHAVLAEDERLRHLAYHHPVTGLPNRAAFGESIGRCLERGPHVVALADVDRFRYINRSRGRSFGDELLRAVGARLQALMPADALFTHPGDDAFLFAYPSADTLERAVATVEAWLTACCQRPFPVHGEDIMVKLHASVLLAPSQADNAESIERSLVAVLAEAINRDQLVFAFTEEAGLRAPRRVELERELRSALAKNEFELFLQPKFEAASKRLTGAEALIRWRHSERGLIPPAEFIPELEETGLVIEVGSWVRREGLAIWRQWDERGYGDLRLAVNVSARELRHADFVSDCTALLASYSGEHGLDIEITESMLMDDVDKSIQILQVLGDLGCSVSIDDFGTGYSSLNYLSRLPVDTVKLDQSFTSSLTSSADTEVLVTNVIGLAHSLGLTVVAEGVEDEGQAGLLRQLDCDELQGYLFGRPMPVAEFESRYMAEPATGIAADGSVTRARPVPRSERKRDLALAARAMPKPVAKPERVGRKLAFVALGALILVSLLFVLREFRQPGEAARAVPGAPVAVAFDSIAVLPFADLSEDKAYEYFADGLSEELLNRLSKLPQLRVIARASSFAFKDQAVDAKTIAGKLKVPVVLEGSVHKSGTALSVSAQLVRASDGARLWSASYDRPMTDVFVVQDEIATAVVAALKLKLLPAQQRVLLQRGTSNPEAYNQYLLARNFFEQSTVQGFELARSALQISIALDPGYAAAYAQLSYTLNYLTDYAESAAAVSEGQRQALELANKAIALDPKQADGYRARASLRRLAFDFPGAMADMGQALRLNPGDSDNQRHYGLLLLAMGRTDEALGAINRAAALDPLSPSALVALSMVHNAQGRWPQAEAALTRALELAPDYGFARGNLGQTYLLEGDTARALATFQGLKEGLWRRWGLALAEHSMGNRAEADAMLAELIKANADSAAYQIAEVYAWRGQTDLAFEWLQRAHAQHDGGLEQIKADPLLGGLHADPRFAALLKKLGLPPTAPV